MPAMADLPLGRGADYVARLSGLVLERVQTVVRLAITVCAYGFDK
jgi:hypothetical protein